MADIHYLSAEAKNRRPPEVANGGNPPNDGDMNERVAKLETHFEYIRKDLDAILSGQEKIIGHIDQMKKDVNAANQHLAGRIDTVSDRLTNVALWFAAAIVGIVVGFAAVLIKI